MLPVKTRRLSEREQRILRGGQANGRSQAYAEVAARVLALVNVTPKEDLRVAFTKLGYELREQFSVQVHESNSILAACASEPEPSGLSARLGRALRAAAEAWG